MKDMQPHTAANWSFSFQQLTPADQRTCATHCLQHYLTSPPDTLPVFDELDPADQDIVVRLTELAALFAHGVLRAPHPPGLEPPIIMEAYGELPASVDVDKYDGLIGDEWDGINLYATYLNHRLGDLEAVLKTYTFQQ